jgi:RimJ/RimL family protein N-acetyltransferase
MSTPNPLLLDIPEVLETERLILRCPLPGDGAAVNAGLRDSWSTLHAWMAWASAEEPPLVDDTEMRQRQNRVDYLARANFNFNAFLKESGEFVGKPGIVRLDWKIPKCEIGYWMCTPMEGKGYMTEAVSALTDFAFETLGMVRVEIRCDPLNKRSAAIAERLGYQKEAHLRNDLREPHGILRDTLIYARVVSL